MTTPGAPTPIAPGVPVLDYDPFELGSYVPFIPVIATPVDDGADDGVVVEADPTPRNRDWSQEDEDLWNRNWKPGGGLDDGGSDQDDGASVDLDPAALVDTDPVSRGGVDDLGDTTAEDRVGGGPGWDDESDLGVKATLEGRRAYRDELAIKWANYYLGLGDDPTYSDENADLLIQLYDDIVHRVEHSAFEFGIEPGDAIDFMSGVLLSSIPEGANANEIGRQIAELVVNTPGLLGVGNSWNPLAGSP